MQAQTELPKKLTQTWIESLWHFHRPVKGKTNKRDFEQLLYENRKELIQLWKAYASQREDLGKLPMSTSRFVVPYLLGFHISNMARAWGVLERVQARQQLIEKIAKAKLPVLICDLGCGTGSMSLAFVHALIEAGVPAKQIQVELIDRSRPLVEAAEWALQQISKDIKIRKILKGFGSEEFRAATSKWNTFEGLQVALCGYFWNEIVHIEKTRNSFLNWTDRLMQSKHPRIMAFFEPAEEASARNSMLFREHLRESGASILYPCPSSKQFCPMLESRKDWCYSEIDWKAPEQALRVSELLKVQRNIIGCSAYVAANPELEKHLEIKSFVGQTVLVGRPRLQGTASLNLLCTGERIERKPAKQKILRGLFASRS